MKQLLLIRHAKSDWGNAELSDFERPLNKRGKENAPQMAERLLRRGIVPQEIISSPAVRAISTAKIFAGTWGISKKEIKEEQAIYEAPVSTLIKVINRFDNTSNFTVLFGHNPGLTMLAVELCDCDIYNIPTCGVVLMEFALHDWKMVTAGTGSLKLFDYPKNEEG